MSSVPHDTLILRKRGQKEYEESARRAIEALAAWCGWNNKDFTHEVQTLDAWCREFGNQRNPGTSADLTAATLFLALAHGRLDNQNLAF
jgi:triphosphoribosyl-dephospho-CoA synthase